ncbi:hypothetical protein EG329_008929 [Mollisiaceae sp. DMI_Dod_QoI]|nr:hypothetical protein EG329_008929 [Helotiales sp. DMI_Dod_QoI]
MLSSFLVSFVVLAAPALVSANCTSWAVSRWLSDGPTGVSNEYQQTVDILACPLADNKTCTFPRKSYDITIPRELNISASPTDADNIFYLAQQFYGLGSRNFTAPPFITRNTTVSTTSRVVSNSLLEVDPGKNTSLVWNPYMLYSFGNLGGCSNASLNGVGVRAAAPYLTNDANNNTVVAGAWGAVTANITNDGTNAARSLKSNGMTGVFVGLAAALFAFVL